MHQERTSCVHRGTSFFGDFDLIGEGPTQTVRVRYNGGQLEARKGQLQAETVAHNLLKELVVLEKVSIKIEQADKAWQCRFTATPHLAERQNLDQSAVA